jgi:3-oxoacyl-[acyl-carrier-protein] synthase-1
MSGLLDILSLGAVTSVGLTAFQTAASCRARIAGFEDAIPLPPPHDPLRAARVPARAVLRPTPTDWLVNLAARGIRESLGYRPMEGRVGLVLALPESARKHAAVTPGGEAEFLARVSRAAGRRFDRTMVAGEGGAAIATGLLAASDLLCNGHLDVCVVGGVDSLVNASDVARLRQAGRMVEPDNPQGVIPGEGAGFLVLARHGRFAGAIARVIKTGVAGERDHVLGPRFSQGRGFAEALQQATGDEVPESRVSFRVSTSNGERYAAWESMFFSSRFYRTRREHLPVWYPASSVGDIGAASGALAIVIAAIGIAGGYAPGPYGMCEAASETGLRGACLIGPAVGSPAPPFRPEEGASLHVISKFRS